MCALALLIVLVMGAVAANSGASKPLDSHEIFVAETANEMIERGAVLVPYYLDAPRLEKPPMAYWLAIAAHWAVGAGDGWVTEFEARLPSLAAAAALLAVTFWMAGLAFGDRRIGLLAAALLGTSWYFFTYARSVRPEMLYTLLSAIEMAGILMALRRAEAGRPTLPGALIAWGAVALALLTKGPQLPLFLMAGAVLALRLRRPRPALGPLLHPFIGIALVALVLPYYGYLLIQGEGVARFWAEQMVQNTEVPIWLRPLRFYYPVRLVIAFLPWAVAFGLGVVWCFKRRHAEALPLASAVLAAIVLVSFAGKLRQHYILPLLPLVAVISAAAAVALHDRAREAPGAARLAGWLIAGQAGLVAAALGAVGWRAVTSHPLGAGAMWPAALPWLVLGGTAALGALALALKNRPAAATAALIASALSVPTAIAATGADIQPHWATAAEFAKQAAKTVGPDRALILVSGDPGPIAYYGRRRLRPVALGDWLAAHPGAAPPYVICQPDCAFAAHGLKARAVLHQRRLVRKRPMVLYLPERADPGRP